MGGKGERKGKGEGKGEGGKGSGGACPTNQKIVPALLSNVDNYIK